MSRLDLYKVTQTIERIEGEYEWSERERKVDLKSNGLKESKNFNRRGV